jgi:hypothetical protein
MSFCFLQFFQKTNLKILTLFPSLLGQKCFWKNWKHQKVLSKLPFEIKWPKKLVSKTTLENTHKKMKSPQRSKTYRKYKILRRNLTKFFLHAYILLTYNVPKARNFQRPDENSKKQLRSYSKEASIFFLRISANSWIVSTAKIQFIR